jgi:hypothetical protein
VTTAPRRPITPATAAEWRRRRAADGQQAPAADDEEPSQGFRVPAYAATLPSQNGDSGGFAQSQRAGLAAMFRIAEADAPPRPVLAAEPGAAQPEPSSSPKSQVVPATLVRQATPVTPPISAPERPGTSVPSASRSAGRSQTRGTQTDQEPRAAGNSSRFGYAPRLLLAVILTVQACLSVRLLNANTAFQDEALYLWAGHLEWAHWLHGATIPQFPAYFSGAPVIYPPIGALADGIGGLMAARVLSLCFMLGATTLLWATASKLYGRTAAFFGAGLWAVLGPTQFLGAFATFDSMSLLLISLATWCAVHSMHREDATRWMLGGAVALALANAAKYASALFDPVVIAIAILAAFPRPGGKAAAGHGASITTYVTALLVSLITLGGSYYWAGLRATTLARADGTNRATVVLHHSWAWIGAVMVAAAVGVALSIVRERQLHRKALLSVLACAGLLVPLEQAHIHTTTSLTKHVDFGAWFAAIAAGYAVDRLVTLIGSKPFRAAVLGAGAAALVAAAAVGLGQAQTFFDEWPNASAFIASLRPLMTATGGRLLIETASDAEYYLPAGSDWERWSSTFSIVLPSGRTIGHTGGITNSGTPTVYARYIARGYFSLVALNFQETPELDRDLANDLDHNSAYQLIASVPYGAGRYIIWRYEPNGAGS